MTQGPKFLEGKRIVLFDEYRLSNYLRRLGAIPVSCGFVGASGYIGMLKELSGDAGIVHISDPKSVLDLKSTKKVVVLYRVDGAYVEGLEETYQKLRDMNIQMVDNRARGYNGAVFWDDIIGALAVAISSPLELE